MYDPSDFEKEYDIRNQHRQFYRSIITSNGTRIKIFFRTSEHQGHEKSKYYKVQNKLVESFPN